MTASTASPAFSSVPSTIVTVGHQCRSSGAWKNPVVPASWTPLLARPGAPPARRPEGPPRVRPGQGAEGPVVAGEDLRPLDRRAGLRDGRDGAQGVIPALARD